MSSIRISHISELYRIAPVYLWVEDEETRAYLEAVWESDDRIGILVAGGCENIAAIVHSARKDSLSHVFGYRDRDFGPSNRRAWASPPNGVFVMEAFEIENLLLDARAIAACIYNTTDKTESMLESEMKAFVGKFDWWMACRRTIVDLRAAVGADFIEHPNHTQIRTLDQARDAILTSPWWQNVRPTISAKVDSTATEDLLKKHQMDYAAMLNDSGNAWKYAFSGKETLIEMKGRVWTKKRRPDPEGRRDFYRAIGESQRQLKTIPDEVIELREKLLKQVGLSGR